MRKVRFRRGRDKKEKNDNAMANQDRKSKERRRMERITFMQGNGKDRSSERILKI